MLLDKRQEFYKSTFNSGKNFKDYLKTANKSQAERWSAYVNRIKVTEEQSSRLKSFTRKMNLICISGIWCGDCMRQVPMLNAISETQDLIELRIFDNQEFPELRDELRIIGGTRVPVLLALSEDFYEVTRFGDRTLSAYKRKAKRELGDACDAGLVPPSEEELNEELTEWFQVIERAQLMLRLSPSLRKKHND